MADSPALLHAGQLAVAEAERLWNLDVYDPPRNDNSVRGVVNKGTIAGIIRIAGWGFALPYLGNGPPQWCGMFAVTCWIKAGLDPSWAATYWASTYRLCLWARYQKFDQKHPNPRPTNGELRLIMKLEPGRPLAWEPRAGDVLIVGDGEPDTGDHITIVVSHDAATGTFDTISGNGGGLGPQGNKREGISRRTYSISAGGYRAMFVIRPAFGDLMAEAA